MVERQGREERPGEREGEDVPRIGFANPIFGPSEESWPGVSL